MLSSLREISMYIGSSSCNGLHLNGIASPQCLCVDSVGTFLVTALPMSSPLAEVTFSLGEIMLFIVPSPYKVIHSLCSQGVMTTLLGCACLLILPSQREKFSYSNRSSSKSLK